MSNNGLAVLKIALQDAVKNQRLISEELTQMSEQGKVIKLVTEQTHLLEETLTLLNRIS